MVLPSLADALVVVVLLVPGFVAFFIARKLSAMTRKFSDLEITIWSIFLSLVGYVPFSLTTGLNTIDSIRDSVLIPANFVILIGYNVLVGIALGYSLKRWRGGAIVSGEVWDHAMREVIKIGGAYAMVYTDNNLEYKGMMNYAGLCTEGEQREVILSNPKLILRDKDWNVLDEVEMGKEVLFTEKDVRRILFFDQIP